MDFLAELDHASAGGKARSLARLAAAGLPTPPGFVITDALFRALRAGAPALPDRLDGAALSALDRAGAALRAAPPPPGFDPALAARLAALGGRRFSVRSSFAAEDDPDALAPGVFESRVDVPLDEVPAAIRAVLASAVAPGAVAYALARGRSPAAPPVAVLVHRFVEADAAGAAALDERAGPDPVISARAGALTAAARATIAAAVRRLAARQGPVELEWAAAGDAVTFLQLRPYRAPAPPRAWPGFAALPAGDPPERWRWDAAHNPLPLSPAQAGLVALVDARCRTGLRQRVLGGYLFHAPGGPPPPRAIAPGEAPEAFAELRALVDRELAALGPTPALEAALALFVAVYEPLFGVVQPAVRRARERLAALVAEHAPGALPALLAGVESLASERRRRAQRIAAAATDAERAAALDGYLALFGDEPAVWDVAAPTARETLTAAVRPAAGAASRPDARRAADQVRQALPADARAAFDEALATARACAAVAEDDDWLYARVQAAVRRALAALGAELRDRGLVDDADDVFYWSLEEARRAAAGAPPADGRALARAGRAAHDAALHAPPPGPAAAPGPVLKGAGTGGRALGTVRLHDPRRPAADRGAVLVAATLLPTELPLVEAAALVTETGGPLDHVAAQARERGLPAVVGAAGACAALRDGDLALVDADQGIVVRIGAAVVS